MSRPEIDNVRYDEMVGRLFPDFQPAVPLWPVYKRAAVWLTLEFAILVIGLAAPRADLGQKVHSVRFLMELGVFIAVGIGAAVLALRTAIPGREARQSEWALLLTAALTSIILIAGEPSSASASFAEFVRAGIRCAFLTGIVAALPWLGLFWAVRRGAPLDRQSAGAFIGVAAFSFALVVGRLGCPVEDSLHFLTWHMLPGAVGVLLSIFAGLSWLQRKKSVQAT
jgi:hypothetical protein